MDEEPETDERAEPVLSNDDAGTEKPTPTSADTAVVESAAPVSAAAEKQANSSGKWAYVLIGVAALAAVILTVVLISRKKGKSTDSK